MNILSHIKKITADRYRKFALPIFVPVILFAVILFAVGMITYKDSVSHTHEFYAEMMEKMAMGCEDKLTSILGGLQFLVREDCVIEFMNMTEPDTWYDTTQLNNAFQDFTGSYSGIDSMFILNTNTKRVIDGSGVKNLADYFSDKYYRSYSSSYWQNIFFWDSSTYRILSPTVYSDENGDRNVIPIVFRKAGNAKSQNFLVVNIDFDVFLERQIKTEIAGQSQVCVLSRYTGQVFGDRKGMAENIFDTELYNMLASGENGFYCNVDGVGKSFIVAYSTTNNMVGYTYFSVIPASHMNRSRYSTILIILAGGIMFMLACLILLRGLKEILKPVNIIIGSAENQGEDYGNIERQVEKLLRQSAELKKLLPFAEEQYLIRYLNSIDFHNNSEVEEMMKNHVNFKYSYFSVVILQMYPDGDFYEIYTAGEYDNIRNGFYNVVEMLFQDKFDTWVLTVEKEAMCVILNTEMPDEERKQGVLENLCEYLKNDMEYINLFIGSGNFHETAEGMKKSYEEAIATIRIVPKPKSEGTISRNMSMLSSRDEMQLFNELIEGNIEDSLERISALANEIKNEGEKNKKQRYSRILNIVLRVMAIKKISYEGKMEYEIYNEALAGNSNDVYRKILVLINAFPKTMERRTSKSESDRIIDYINENYNNTELSREMIAEVFNTQPNYLSTLIKNRIGINFKDYIVNIRIEKAKELLLRGDKSIQEIYEEVGFGSKQTFYRTFKRAVGITPNEYKRDTKEEKKSKIDENGSEK